jgi:hypothetical protein
MLMTARRFHGRGLTYWVALALPALAIAGVGLGYVLLNLGRLGEQSYWTDELLSVGFANEGLQRMLRLLGGDTTHPPLYSSVLWLWIRLTGTATEATVRLLSLLAIATGIVVLGIAAWRRIGTGAAAVFLTLGVTSTLVATFAREARPHGLAFGLVCCTTAAWMLVLSAAPIRLRSIATFAVLGGLASLTQYYALLVYTVEVAVLVGWLGVGRRWREAAVTLAVTGLSVVPVGVWLVITNRLLHASSTPALTTTWAEVVAGWAAEPFTSVIFGSGIDVRRGLLLVSAILALAAIGLLIGFLHMLWDARPPGSPRRAAALGLGAAAMATGVIAVGIAVVESLVLLPTFHYRSIVTILPVLYVGIGAAFTVPFRRLGGVAGVSVAMVLAATALPAPEPGLYTKDQWREAAAIVVSDVRAGLPASRVAVVESPWGTRADVILVLNNAVGRRAPASDLPAELDDLSWINSSAGLMELPADQRLLLVAFHYYTFGRHAAIVATAQERFGPCEDRSVTGITVLSCDPAAAP